MVGVPVTLDWRSPAVRFQAALPLPALAFSKKVLLLPAWPKVPLNPALLPPRWTESVLAAAAVKLPLPLRLPLRLMSWPRGVTWVCVPGLSVMLPLMVSVAFAPGCNWPVEIAPPLRTTLPV